MRPLYDRDGRAIAYITDDDTSIYFYDGTAAGWIYQNGLVFAYSGKFLGWFMYGWVCDPKGNPAFFTDRSSGGPRRPVRHARPVRAPRGPRPKRNMREVRPARPGMTSTWSPLSWQSFFGVPAAGSGSPAGAGGEERDPDVAPATPVSTEEPDSQHAADGDPDPAAPPEAGESNEATRAAETEREES